MFLRHDVLTVECEGQRIVCNSPDSALRPRAQLRKPRTRPEWKTADIGIVAEAVDGEHRGRSVSPKTGQRPSIMVRDRTMPAVPTISPKRYWLKSPTIARLPQKSLRPRSPIKKDGDRCPEGHS